MELFNDVEAPWWVLNTTQSRKHLVGHLRCVYDILVSHGRTHHWAKTADDHSSGYSGFLRTNLSR